jgi:hypothetical protein
VDPFHFSATGISSEVPPALEYTNPTAVQ